MNFTDGQLENDRHIKPSKPQCKTDMFQRRISVQNIKKKFLERGYSCELVEENLRRGVAIPRAVLLRPKTVYPQQDCPALLSKPRFTPVFRITYNPHNPKLHQCLREAFTREKTEIVWSFAKPNS